MEITSKGNNNGWYQSQTINGKKDQRIGTLCPRLCHKQVIKADRRYLQRESGIRKFSWLSSTIVSISLSVLLGFITDILPKRPVHKSGGQGLIGPRGLWGNNQLPLPQYLGDINQNECSLVAIFFMALLSPSYFGTITYITSRSMGFSPTPFPTVGEGVHWLWISWPSPSFVSSDMNYYGEKCPWSYNTGFLPILTKSFLKKMSTQDK